MTLIVLFSCGNSKQDDDRTDKNTFKATITEDNNTTKEKLEQKIVENDTLNTSVDFQMLTLENEFRNATLFKLEDTITTDFNGDGNIDKAFFVKESETSGIIIRHGIINTEVRFGFGQEFAHLKDFDWVDFWGLVKDSTTYEIIFDETDILGDTIIGLENPSIVVRKEEVGGGLITFKNGEYNWIHQSD